MAPLCAEYGISRKTGDKLFDRYKDRGVTAVTDRSPSQNVGVTRVGDHVWLVTFMHYDLKYFDGEGRSRGADRESLRPESVTHVSGMKCYLCLRNGPSKSWLLRLDSNQQPSG